ncbi:MAG TPA: metallophosphoesterase, partial [Polyangiaceae bacterium]|nr:metallophosphoesterase [Polyangiaceae bacterium]
DPIVFHWLDDWLALGAGQLHVVAMHIPPLDPIGVRNGAFASRNEAAKLLARLAAAGVDLTLYGHIHSYYSFDNAGIPAFISGGGGAIPERFDDIGRHFLIVDADPIAQSYEVRVVRVD